MALHVAIQATAVLAATIIALVAAVVPTSGVIFVVAMMTVFVAVTVSLMLLAIAVAAIVLAAMVSLLVAGHAWLVVVASALVALAVDAQTMVIGPLPGWRLAWDACRLHKSKVGDLSIGSNGEIGARLCRKAAYLFLGRYPDKPLPDFFPGKILDKVS